MLFHTDKYLHQLALLMGPWIYVLVFAIVFCETGLVVTPFLPGDSLLFALGSLVAMPSQDLSIGILSVGFLCATFAGDNVNYFFGKKVGPKVFNKRNSKIFNQKYLQRTHEFYEKHGPKAVILARFVPIVRTFVPFVAGVGCMPYRQFIAYSLFGSVLWTQVFLWMGYFFGNSEIVQKNFQMVILAVIFLSVLPALLGVLKSWRRGRATNE